MKKLIKITLGLFAVAFLFGCTDKAAVESGNVVEIENNNTAQPEGIQETTQEVYKEDPDAIKIVVNGEALKTSSPPETKDGTTMVPFRDIFNALGVSNDEIVWNQTEKSVTATHNENTVFFIIDNVYAAADGKSVEMPVAAYVNEKGVTMVPARFISESMRAKVRWEGETRTVSITTKK